ncbi:MAG TPA: sialate O-acetylesterase, partial [Saprospiraceae bacterium]|nr:sialate O-acetylesterase [Saprospiraceae bacterium]
MIHLREINQNGTMHLYTTLSILSLMLSVTSKGNVVLPAIFNDNMVLQQQSEVTIWGWAKPLEKVTIHGSWQDTSVETIADNQANWAVLIHTPAAGGPYSIEIRGYNRIVLQNVLIGEVWLCAGQSNMEWTARMGIDNAQIEVQQASFPNLRFLTIAHRSASTPQVDVSADVWKACGPETMIDFSAVAYFFARRLQQDLNVPIGLINASWGGTPAEAWTALDFCPDSALIRKTAAELSDVPWGPEEPASIYNAMIAPLIRYRIAGVIWYQGESNAEHVNYDPSHYYKVFPAMLTSWRNAWGYLFPFYFVQIAPYRNYLPNSGVIIRDAQRRALSLPQTGMVVTSDIGNVDDIHPANKQDVGIRLARIALRRHYHIDTGYDSGPLYRSHEIRDDHIIIHFEHADGLHAQ